METRFELEYCLTKKQYTEVYRRFSRRRMIWVVIAAIAGFYFLFRGILLQSLLLIACGLFELFLAIRGVLLPWLRAGKVMKQIQEFDGTPGGVGKTLFADEMIIDETPSETRKFPYEKITEIYVSDSLIVLTDIRKMGIIMSKHGFTKGTFEEFMDFIREKCPQLKLTKW